MTQQEIQCFRQALRAMDRREIQVFEQLDEPIPSYTEQFERKIEKLFRTEQKWTWQFTKTPKRRLLSVVFAIILISALTASVTATRDPVFSAFERITEKFTEIIFPTKSNTPSIEYEVSWIPEKYELVFSSLTDTSHTIEWQYGDFYITFDQIMAGNIHYDTENSVVQKMILGNKKVSYYQKKNTYLFSWSENGYFFTLTCPDDIPWEDIVRMIESIHPTA